MQTFRAYANADTALTLYVRDDAGQMDLEEVDALTLAISRYGVSAAPLTTVEAASPSAGKITATISADVSENTLGPGLYRLDTLADGVTLRSDVLEVV